MAGEPIQSRQSGMPDNPKTVLIAEDNPLNMKLAADLLQLNGFRPLKAADGESTLQLLESQPVDLILMDINLPGLDGFQLFSKIRADARFQRIPIVALTAMAMREDQQKIREFGFSDYIAKPIDTKLFVEKVRKLLCDGA
jgi:CheY-like chemotaxis protein